MENMDGWDVALMVIAGYVATMSLVRLMVRRRDQMLDEFRGEMKAAKSTPEAEEKQPQERKVA